jgi:solute carrier family 8 (sodium/calcium exchanger)
MTVTIIDDDDPGELAFEKRNVSVLESVGMAQIPVVRNKGSNGQLQVQWKTTDQGNAVAGTNYTPVAQQDLVFLHGEMRKYIEVEIFDNDAVDGDHDFGLILFHPSEGTKLDSEAITMDVRILDDDGLANKLRQIDAFFSKASSSAAFVFYSRSWAHQFTDAMVVYGEDGEDPSGFDYIMHVLTFGWKLVFAIVPPTTYCGGWAAFGVALAFIGGLTGVVGK